MKKRELFGGEQSSPYAQELSTVERSKREREFMRNVVEARANGFEVLCAECGIGVHDDSDIHERWCSAYVPWDGR